jgi:hypothetical protein
MLARRVIRRGNFTSKADLARMILAYIAYRPDSKPDTSRLPFLCRMLCKSGTPPSRFVPSFASSLNQARLPQRVQGASVGLDRGSPLRRWAWG